MSRIRSVALAVALLVTGLLLAGLSVQPAASSPDVRVIAGVGSHGLHVGDLPLVFTWAAAMALCSLLWIRD